MEYSSGTKLGLTLYNETLYSVAKFETRSSSRAKVRNDQSDYRTVQRMANEITVAMDSHCIM